MAFTVPSAEPRRRPTVVTVAVAMLGAYAFCRLLGAGMDILVAGDLTQAYERAYDGADEADLVIQSTTILTYAMVGISLVMALGVVVLAMFNAKGSQPARVVTWVLGGLTLCCSAISGVMGLAAGMVATTTDESAVSADELNRWIEHYVPGWYQVAGTAISVIAPITMLVAVILLALPAANEFFRKPIQQWQPPIEFPNNS